VEAVEGSSSVCNVIHPLIATAVAVNWWTLRQSQKPHLLWLRNHHMTIHENPWYTLRNARKYGSTCVVRVMVNVVGKIGIAWCNHPW